MQFGGELKSGQTGSVYTVVGEFWGVTVGYRNINEQVRVRIQGEEDVLEAMQGVLGSFDGWSEIKGGDHISTVTSPSDLACRVMQATLAIAYVAPPVAFDNELDDETDEEGEDDEEGEEEVTDEEGNDEDDEPENNLAAAIMNAHPSIGSFVTPKTQSKYRKLSVVGDAFVAFRDLGGSVRIRFQASSDKLSSFMGKTSGWNYGETGQDHVSVTTDNITRATSAIDEAISFINA
jgi:hypothetical protein